MIAVNDTTARQRFDEYCDKTVSDFEPVVITREKGDSVVLMSETEYNNLLENVYIRSNPTDYYELLESTRQLKRGQGRIRELVEHE